MFYTIYKITNKVNNKIYIGMHQTNNVDDEYMGSGKLIRNAIRKYGINNFTKKILYIFDNELDMILKEKELVTEEFVKQENTYNLCQGGKGGSLRKGVILSEEIKQKISLGTKKGMSAEHVKTNLSNKRKNRKTKQSTKDKISKRVSDSIWIKKDNISKMIQPDELNFYLSKEWELGRIMDNAMKNSEIAKRNGLSRRRSFTYEGITYGCYKQAAKALNKSPSYMQGLVKKGLAFFGDVGSGF